VCVRAVAGSGIGGGAGAGERDGRNGGERPAGSDRPGHHGGAEDSAEQAGDQVVTKPTTKATTKPKSTTKAVPGCPAGERQREVETALAELGGFGPVTVDGKQGHRIARLCQPAAGRRPRVLEARRGRHGGAPLRPPPGHLGDLPPVHLGGQDANLSA
jgi:hypothetical protein